MRNKIEIRQASWQRTDQGWQTEFACPVVYHEDLPWIECRCRDQVDFYLNGEFLQSRQKGSGHIPLTGKLRPGRNCLEIRGESQPDISLLITPKSHFRVSENGESTLSCSCSWTPGSGILKVEADLLKVCDGDTLRLQLKDPEGQVLDAVEVPARREDPVDLMTAHPALWEGVRDPARMEIVAQLLRRGKVKDEVRLFTGMRTIALAPDGGLLLNDKPYPIRGRILSWDDDLMALKEAGYTAVWDQSGEPGAWLLEECDRLGLMVFSTLIEDDLQKEAADGHVSLCFWVRSPQSPEARDATRLILEPDQLKTDNLDFTL